MKYLKFAAIPLLLLVIVFGVCWISCSKETSSKEAVFVPNKEKRISDKGIYVTAWVAQTPKRFAELRKTCKAHNINTIVVDVKEMISKDITDLIKKKELKADTKIAPSPWLQKLTSLLHEEGFIVSARIVTFKDDHLAIARPDLAIKMKTGGIYRDRKGGKWVDPYSAEVRLYNTAIAECAALSGADEIQFDYIRFPAEGGTKNMLLSFEDKKTRVETITLFLKETRERLKKYNVSMAADIFGVTAWQSKTDVVTLGQSVTEMANYLDVLSPMLYPSHFHNGYDGYSNPGAYPYYFVNAGVIKTQSMIMSSEAHTQQVPWIQGFNMKSPNYGPGYIAEQIRACKDAGVNRYLIWNARNVYDNLP